MPSCSHTCAYRQQYWQRHDYTSLNIALESSSEEEDEVEEQEEELEPSDREIHYVMGNVAEPQNTGTRDAIVVHCVGEYMCHRLIVDSSCYHAHA